MHEWQHAIYLAQRIDKHELKLVAWRHDFSTENIPYAYFVNILHGKDNKDRTTNPLVLNSLPCFRQTDCMRQSKVQCSIGE